MPTSVWIITQFEYDDSIMIGCSFNTEAYTDENKAQERFEQLKGTQRPYEGFGYILSETPLNVPRN